MGTSKKMKKENRLVFKYEDGKNRFKQYLKD